MGSDCQPAPNDKQSLNIKWPEVIRGTNTFSGDTSNGGQVDDQSIPLSAKVDRQTNLQAKIHEESTKKALLLKKKELKWKLMQASQAVNQAKLKEIKTALMYHKRKLFKAQTLAAKLRSKYVKVVRSAKLTEAQYKTAETELASHEKHLADEKMQLTRLALECINTGTLLYGNNYKLPENHNHQLNLQKAKISRLKPSNQLNRQPPSDIQSKPQDEPKTQETKEEILKKLSPFLRRARAIVDVSKDNLVRTSHNVVIDNVTSNVLRPNLTMKKRKRTSVSRLSSLYDLNDSILKNLASYRLTRKFAEIGTTQLTDLAYSHNIHPLEYVCLPDLLGECPDKSCPYQHKSNYFMTDLEKLTDLLSYRPAVAGWIRGDDDLDKAENYRVCRVKLKQHAARLISKNAEKPVEVIARAIVANDIRQDESDIDLLMKHRRLPKEVHLKNPQPIECSPDVVLTEIETKDDTTISEDHSQAMEL